jgi:hypothetical protein
MIAIVEWLRKHCCFGLWQWVAGRQPVSLLAIVGNRLGVVVGIH